MTPRVKIPFSVILSSGGIFAMIGYVLVINFLEFSKNHYFLMAFGPLIHILIPMVLCISFLLMPVMFLNGEGENSYVYFVFLAPLLWGSRDGMQGLGMFVGLLIAAGLLYLPAAREFFRLSGIQRTETKSAKSGLTRTR